MSFNTQQTEAVLTHHLEAFGAADIDAIISDYTEDSILYKPDGTVRGLDQLREFFTGFIANLPPTLMENFEMLRQDVEGEIAYIVWKGGDAAPLGTDTFVVRDGKIVTQTFAAYLAP